MPKASPSPPPTSAPPCSAKLPPDIAYYTQSHSELGFVHRHTDGGEIYFIVNTSNQPVADTAVLRTDVLTPERWDALTGQVSPVTDAKMYTGATGGSL